MKLYWVDVGYACFGMVANDKDIIVDVAPIAKWMLGKSLQQVKPWLLSKKAKVIWVKE